MGILLTGCFSAPPQIVSLEPNRGSTSVAADAAVRVQFDRAVLRSSVVGRFSVIPGIPGCDLTAAFSAPSIGPCWIHWLPGATGFELLHEQAVFAPSTRYEFTLSGGVTDLANDSNNLDHHWDLTTAAAPRVAAVTPSDGTAGLAVDSPLAVTFNTAMDAPTTAAAISLAPAVPGTRVFRNLRNRNRFVILPGRLLDPGVHYTITVGSGARGEDNQALAAPVAARFTTGTRLGTTHAVVLAGVPGEAPTEVLLPALAAAAAGEPAATPLLVAAGRCPLPQCGAVANLGPLQTYAAAAIAPDAAHVAVVVNSGAGSRPSSALEVIDTVEGTVDGEVAGATRPSWSPSGALVAFVSPAGVEVFDALTGAVTMVAADTSLLSAPLWVGDSGLVLSTSTGGERSSSRVVLVDRLLDARYDVPSAPAGTVAGAISPAGDQLALTAAQGAALVVPIGAGTGSAVRLNGGLEPVGFAGEGTLFAISQATAAARLVRVDVVGGDTTTIPLDIGLPDLATVRAAPDGRRLVFLGLDDQGVLQADVANADGSGALQLTRFLAGELQAQAIDFSN